MAGGPLNREPEAESRKPEAESGKPEAESGKREAESRQPATGSGTLEAGGPHPRWQTALLAVPALATVACLAGVVRFLVWTSNRGLDITDEGFCYLGARYPGDPRMTVTSHYLLSPLFAATGWNVPVYRVTGFAITVIAAFVLAAGLDAVRRRLDPESPRSWTYVAAEAAAIGVGSLLGNSWLLTSPSYNTITNWGLSIGAAATMVAAARGEADRVTSAWLALLGLALGFVFLAKFTAAIAAGAVFAGVLLAWPLAPARVRVRWLAAAAAGFALALAFYFAVFQSPAGWLRAVRLGLWGAATQSPLHRAGAATRYYLEWRDDVVLAWLKDFGPVFYTLTALAIAIRLVPPDRWLGGRAVRVVAWAGVAYAAYVAAVHVRDYPPSLYQYDVTRLFFGWMLLLGPLALAWRGSRVAGGGLREAGSKDPAYEDDGGRTDVGRTDGGRVFRPGTTNRTLAFAWTLIVVMLFALPFCGSVGTGNPLQYGMRYTLAPWFALLALALGRLSAPARVRWAVPVGLAVLSAYAAVYLVKGPLEAPYRLLTGIRGQTEDTPIGAPASIVKLDPVLHAFITDVRRAALDTGFRPGDDILGLYDMPGIVYALGGRSPGTIWWTMGYPGSRTVMERAVALAGPDRLRRAYILQTKASTEWLQSLTPLGVNFPDDYVLGGTFTIPYSWTREEVSWWRPRNR